MVRLLTGAAGPGSKPADIAKEARRIMAVREVRATLTALAQLGSEARYLPVDVRDAGAVAEALAEVRREWGPVTGVIHGAGTLADKLVADKTDEQFEQVFDTKVAGLRAVLDAVSPDPLEVICLFSSAAGWFGNAGQGDYAMANATLDQVASVEQAMRPDCLVRSLAWGPWDGGMVGPLLAEQFTRRGVPLIPPAAGTRAFLDEIAGAGDDTRVLLTAGEPDPSEGAVGGRPDPELGQVSVSGRTHPWLADHSPAGTAVLPLAMAVDLLARGVLAWKAGGPRAVALRDLHVLRKISFPELAGAGHRVLVRGQWADAAGGVREQVLRLETEDGTPHYLARLADGPPRTDTRSAWTTPAGLEEIDFRMVYDGQWLFHGPQCRAIRTLTGISAEGAEAVIVGLDELGWGRDDWYLDVAALDGGMQLAGVWATLTLGSALPMAVRECRIHIPGLLSGPTRSIVRSRGVNGTGARCDVAVLDDDGAPRIELLDVEMVLRPDRILR
jgi:NAD(P)-dependent dehydrogenase (short-subunit alcohol dehydrogenase family)